ncbi:MAG: hypothetical protein K2X60_02475 [Xanthobacteraceae bacterium]|nr:hypothetical protein [Xanthobacteraceae bacterium]
MPRYFFNTRIGGDLIPDKEGSDLRDPDHAWKVARATIRKLLKAQSNDVTGRSHLMTAVLEITDSAGDIVLEFPFSEALIDPDESPTTH